ncbi:MAG: PorV/PorQ family protein [Ignavibacteriales bacterium]|nr:PorV/PorQ family protein [Ignavibacteriales bacterium]
MKKLVIILLILCFYLPTAAQETNKVGTTSAQFLKIGVGAAEMAMAGANTALISNGNSMYWNPAGMTGLYKMTFYASHTNWFADISHNFFGIVMPVGEDHRFGLSATVLTMGKMEITTELKPQGTGEFFEANDIAIGVSYAGKLVDFFSFGATIKYITQNIYNESASAIAIDLGTQLNTGFNGIKIGMNYSNFGTKMKLEGRDLQKTYDPNPTNATNTGVKSDLTTEEWELPVNFRVGIGWDVIAKYDAYHLSNIHSLKVEIDANHPNDGPENLLCGMEYGYNGMLFLRGGYHFNHDVYSYSLGLGLNWSAGGSFEVGFDYAFADLDILGPVHTFSTNIGL